LLLTNPHALHFRRFKVLIRLLWSFIDVFYDAKRSEFVCKCVYFCPIPTKKVSDDSDRDDLGLTAFTTEKWALNITTSWL
jgi:hypothetical protein